MNILLEENLKLTNMPLNLVLEKKIISKNKETGEETEKWVVDGYYTTLGGALKGYLKKSVLESEAKSLEELANEIKRIENNIDKAIEEIRRNN